MNLLLSQHIPAARRTGTARQAVLMNRGSTGRSVFASVLALWFSANTCLVPALFASGGQEDSPKDQAKALAKQAKRAAKKSKDADAYLLYSEAAAMAPNNK